MVTTKVKFRCIIAKPIIVIICMIILLISMIPIVLLSNFTVVVASEGEDITADIQTIQVEHEVSDDSNSDNKDTAKTHEKISIWRADKAQSRARQTESGSVIRVMFDDAHLPAFTVDPNNDADNVHGFFGSGEGGYSSFADVLVDPEGMEMQYPGHTFDTPNTYEVVILNEGEQFTPEVFEDIDVLVVPMTFNGDYETSEIDAIEDFVKNGGGLLLIADHSGFPVHINDIAERFYVYWGDDVVTDNNDYTGPYNYWLVYEDNGVPGDDNMPKNDYDGDADNDGIPDYKDPDSPLFDEHEIWKITQYASTVQYYCSNAYTLENPAEAEGVIITDTDGSCNYPNEPACLAIPGGNCTGAGRAVFIPDCNVFGDSYDCDGDGLVDFWDEHNAEFALGIIDWLAPREYDVALVSGTDDPTTGLPMPLIHFYEPGETHTYDIEAWNLGLREDVIELSIINENENWSAELTITETPPLQPDTYVNFGLTVTAPFTNVSDGDFAIIKVKAVSQGDPGNATDTISSTNIIKVELDFAVNFGVEPDVDMVKRDEIDPGAMNVYSIGISNLGNVYDKYNLKLDGAEEQWEIFFDNTEHPEWPVDKANYSISDVPVWPGESESAVLRVRAPVNAEEGKVITLTVYGTSQLSLISPGYPPQGLVRSDTLELKVTGIRAIVLRCDDPEHHVNPGETTIYEVNVKNNGNGIDRVDLNIRGDFGCPVCGWEVPPDALECPNPACSITLTHGVWWAEFGLYVCPNCGNEVSPTAEVCTNCGKNFKTSGTGPRLVTTFELNPGEEKTAYLKVTAPADARADSRLTLGLTARSHIVQQTFEHDGPITTIVNRVYKLDASITPEEEVVCNPGDTIKFNITVTNLGNDEDMITPVITMMAIGWDANFYQEDLEVEEVCIEPFDTQTICLEVKVPTDAKADSNPATRAVEEPYTIGINISGEGTAVPLTATVKVAHVYEIEVYADARPTKIDPGNSIIFTVKVTNLGNGEDLIRLTGAELMRCATGEVFSPDKYTNIGWGLKFIRVALVENTINLVPTDFDRPLDIIVLYPSEKYGYVGYIPEGTPPSELNIILAPEQELWVTIEVNIGSNAITDTYMLELWVDSNGTTITPDCKVTFTLIVVNSDLTVGTIECLSTVTEGKLITIRIWIKNIGEIDAVNVGVRFLIDGNEMGYKDLDRIRIGDQCLATFTWRAEAGKHKLTVEVDPDNRIIEQDENNNVAEKQISVKSKRGWFGPGFEAYTVLWVFIIYLVVLYTYWKRKRL